MKLKNGDRLVMIGDSVTDMGRGPDGNGLSETAKNYGCGYPNVVAGLLGAIYPELTIRLTNVGNNGNRSRELKARWQHDVMDLKPDWLSILIGINDVWRQFDNPAIPEAHVLIDEYENTLRELVSKTKPILSGGLILMTPYYMEPNPQDWMRAKMDEYGAVCKKIAAEQGVYCVDLQAAFNKVLQYVHSSFIAWDRVHPNIYGATLIARELLKVLDFDFNHEP